MPIVSRELKHVHPQIDGTVRVRERLTNTQGRVTPHSYRFVPQSDPAVLQTYQDAIATLVTARVAYQEAKKTKNQVVIDSALVDVQAANTALVAPMSALVTVATTEATVTMDARDMTAQLRSAERKEVIDFVRDGSGTPNDFTHVDLTVPGKRRAALRHFSRNKYEDDPKFFDNIAVWISGLTESTIESVLSVNNTRATNIKDRATAMQDTGGLSEVSGTDAGLIDSEIEVE